MISRILSGGQTGVDRAALDLALELGIPIGGYCPLGRRAEDGLVPDRYPLVEMPTIDYAARTRRNIEAADFTLILTGGKRLTPGTRLTDRFCKEMQKRHYLINVTRADVMGYWVEFHRAMLAWLSDPGESYTVNVAGPRESKCPGIYEAARVYLRKLLAGGK